MSIDVSQYKVGVVLSLEDCGKTKAGKNLRACKVNVGDEGKPITVVTVAQNVRQGSRLAVAGAGSTVMNIEGEEMEVKKTSVGGVMSEGMFCDSKILGWAGGSTGVAQVIPEEFALGSAPPASKPRAKGADTAEVPHEEVKGLFDKKLSKEEKKKLAEERKKERAAKKAAKKAEES